MTNRPKIISIICVIGYLSVLFTFPQVFSPTIKKLGVFTPAIFGILVAAQFIACVGIWYFKRWGVNLYLISFFARLLFYILTDQVGPSLYITSTITIVFIFFLVKYYRQMDPNL